MPDHEHQGLCPRLARFEHRTRDRTLSRLVVCGHNQRRIPMQISMDLARKLFERNAVPVDCKAILSVNGGVFASGDAVPCGKVIGSASSLCMDSDASRYEASKKNITSIIGMISMRPRRERRARLIFMVRATGACRDSMHPDRVGEARKRLR
jgi:hypothetical protein